MRLRTRPAGGRPGFTMVEILVVILIIALLVGLLIPAVSKVSDSAKRGKAQFQANQISMQADVFCNSETMNKPGRLPQPPFTLRPVYTNINDAEAVYLKQLFPNLPPAPGMPNTVSTGLSSTITLVDGNEIATFFLTGGEVTQYSGFSNNSQRPFDAAAAGEVRKGPFIQATPEMVRQTGTGRSVFVDPFGSPYAIFIGRNNDYGSQVFPATGDFNGTVVNPYYRAGTPRKYEQPKGIQVISAGQNKRFGRGGDWATMVDNQDALDDISNFSTAGLGYGPN